MSEQSASVPAVERFHRVLVESIREKAPAYLDDGFTVAEIYQFLVPYRTHRDRLGLSMSGDYEDTLLRLLAGEGGLLMLDSEAARSRIRAELGSRNPNTGIYREFAGAEVRLKSQTSSESTARPAEGRPRKRASSQEEASTSSEVAAPRAPQSPDPETSASAEAACPDCEKPLPDRASMRFCPHCGTNLLEVPCRACGEVLDRGWNFCIACGQPTGT